MNFNGPDGDFCYLDSLNDTLRFILQSCPKLEHCQLTGGVYVRYASGPVDLDFLHCSQLRSIEIDLYDNSYYTFNHIASKSGKRWVNYHRCIKDEEFDSRNLSYHVNLA